MNHYYEDRYYTDRTGDFRRHMSKTYGLMCGGLALTFVTALLTSLVLPIWFTFSLPVSIILLVAEVITVVAFSALLHKASYGTVVAMFLFYALLTGFSISYIFVLYNMTTIFLAFAAASVSFAIMALIGHFTKRDLSVFGRLFFAGLVGLILMSIACLVLSLFMEVSILEWLICVVGLILFLGITAFDTQRMQRVFENTAADNAVAKKYAVFFAMQLYLDFINIFVYLLRLVGRRD